MTIDKKDFSNEILYFNKIFNLKNGIWKRRINSSYLNNIHKLITNLTIILYQLSQVQGHEYFNNHNIGKNYRMLFLLRNIHNNFFCIQIFCKYILRFLFFFLEARFDAHFDSGIHSIYKSHCRVFRLGSIRSKISDTWSSCNYMKFSLSQCLNLCLV